MIPNDADKRDRTIILKKMNFILKIMQKLPFVLVKLIDSYLNLRDHVMFASTCKYTQRLENYKIYWDRYLKGGYVCDLRFLVFLIKYHNFNDVRILRYCNNECAHLFISTANFNLNDGMLEACRSGNIEIARLINAKRTERWYDWQRGLLKACRSGNIEIVRLAIENGANDWNRGLFNACRGGNFDIVQLMIDKGADHWEGGLTYACIGGHVDIVLLMIEKGAKRLNKGLRHAYNKGKKDVVRVLIEKGATIHPY